MDYVTSTGTLSACPWFQAEEEERATRFEAMLTRIKNGAAEEVGPG